MIGYIEGSPGASNRNLKRVEFDESPIVKKGKVCNILF